MGPGEPGEGQTTEGTEGIFISQGGSVWETSRAELPCSFSEDQPRVGQGPQQRTPPAPSLVPGAKTHGPHLGDHRVEGRWAV